MSRRSATSARAAESIVTSVESSAIAPASTQVRTFFEFFAGGGMARAGLGADWSCRFANDFDHRKGETYVLNWGDLEFVREDVAKLSVCNLPRTPHLVWGSFPCQDLSLAGGGAGLRGDRSGTFWPFWRLMRDMSNEGPAPNVIVLENVCGTLTSHEGKDFEAIVLAFASLGYRVGAMVVDAELFVPQSRPRLFFVCVPRGQTINSEFASNEPSELWHPPSMRRAFMRLSDKAKDAWVWWRMPAPPRRKAVFADLVEAEPSDVEWHSPAETKKLLGMMTPLHKKKVEKAKSAGRLMVGTIYRRTRPDSTGSSVQRAEVRFDDVAGCLRTPAGGSSRQVLLIVDGKSVRSRLISARETARLMGLPDTYVLPERYNEAYHLTGDGLVVPAVNHLSQSLLVPLVDAVRSRRIQ